MILIVVGIIVFFMILYFVIRFAVRDGMADAHNIVNSNRNEEEIEGQNISKITCSNCGKKHDMDYPKCPYCKHQH